jgi:hypothetical protein
MEFLRMKFDSRKIVERLKEHYSFSEDKELAVYLGINNQKVYNWKKRNTLDLTVILAKCPDVDLNWLFRGVVLNDKAREELEAVKTRLAALEKKIKG